MRDGATSSEQAVITRQMDPVWLDRHPDATTADGRILAQSPTPDPPGPSAQRASPYCRLLPPEAFPASGPGPVPRSPPPAEHPVVSMVMTSRTAGMLHAPTALDLVEGMRSENPTDVQQTAISTWLHEATESELILAMFQGVYSIRDLARALHLHGWAARRYALSRTLNQYCRPQWRDFRIEDDPWHDGY